jgi:uncharacterized protein (TIGR03435 family)
VRLIFAICVLAGTTVAQPRFEVASVKSGGDDAFATRPTRTTGRLQWRSQLCSLIGYAYSVDPSRVSGPKCGEIYAIEAKFGPDATENQVREMLQGLLAERFHLRVRRDTTQADGLALVLGKDGPKLKESGAEGESYCSAILADGGALAITGRRATMAQLATTLGRSTGSAMWDRTGLSGSYDFAFRFAFNVSPDAVSTAPGLGTALQGLGLKLDRQKGPIDTLVIEHVEEPTEN